MPRLVVVLPLSPMRDGDSFAVKDWPLHITVSPPFLTDAAPSDIADMAPERRRADERCSRRSLCLRASDHSDAQIVELGQGSSAGGTPAQACS